MAGKKETKNEETVETLTQPVRPKVGIQVKPTPQLFKSLTKSDEPVEIEQEGEGSLFESIAKRLIDELLSSQTNLKMKSDLNIKQISALTKVYIYAEQFDSSLAQKVADTLLELLVSKSRLGRIELTQLAKGLSDYGSVSEGPSRMDILTGKGL
jgi:hypothetical protein